MANNLKGDTYMNDDRRTDNTRKAGFPESSPDSQAAMTSRICKIREQIAQAAEKAGRSPDEITLIGVSKRFPASSASLAVRSGLQDLGENRVQEMLPKIDQLAAEGLTPNWHLIGTLQKNKVKYVVGKCYLIHSVDSLKLLEALSKRSVSQETVTRVLLQVNSSGEDSKHGFDPVSLTEEIRKAFHYEGLSVCGLMTMAPLTENPQETLPVFQKTQDLFEQIRAMPGTPESFNCLSMGMSQDFRQAVLCGATHVRIGTALFGSRDQ